MTVTASEKKIAFTICATNYLGKARALLDSLHRHCPDYETFIVLIDDLLNDSSHAGVQGQQIIPWKKIGNPRIDEMRQRYEVVEFSTAIKPFCFEYLFAKNPAAAKILYLDPDILVFHDFEPLEAEFAGNDILLTPHFIAPNMGETSIAELRVAPTGVYNLGFIGLTRSQNTANFLTWWGNKLIRHSVCDHKEGLFYDQNWVTYAPLFFERVVISKHPGLNVAVWNLHERTITLRDDTFMINQQYPLIFFHFSQFNTETKHSDYLPYGNWGLTKVDAALNDLCVAYGKALAAADHAGYATLAYRRPGHNAPLRLSSIVFGRLIRWLARLLSPEVRTMIRRQIQGI